MLCLQPRRAFKTLLVLFVVSHMVDSGALDRLKGGFPAVFRRTSTALAPPPPPPPPPSIFQSLTGQLSNAAAGLFHAVGSFLPLRGIASLAADIGIPGAAALMHFLTPRSTPRLTSAPSSRSFAASPFGHHRSASGRRAGQQGGGGAGQGAANKGYSPFRAEIQSIVGAAHGEQGCVMKLACLSGKRLSSLSGASAVAMMLAAATDMMPHGLRDPYTAMKNSVMYSDDCSQYTCSKDREDL